MVSGTIPAVWATWGVGSVDDISPLLLYFVLFRVLCAHPVWRYRDASSNSISGTILGLPTSLLFTVRSCPR